MQLVEPAESSVADTYILGLPDPDPYILDLRDPDPLEWGTDPDYSIIKQK